MQGALKEVSMHQLNLILLSVLKSGPRDQKEKLKSYPNCRQPDTSMVAQLNVLLMCTMFPDKAQ
jgi:hypothetical protein